MSWMKFSSIMLFLIFSCSGIFAQAWKNNGPFGGYITALIIDPADTNIIYAGTYGGGIFKSVNAAQSWAPINNGFPTWKDSTVGSPTLPSWWFGDFYPVTSLRIHSQNPGHIYAGTSGGGIAQSLNGGGTWAPTNGGLPDSAIVSDLWLHPDTTSILFCGLRLPNGGLYQSTDGGQNWTLVPGVPSGKTYTLTTINHEPGNPTTLYVGVSSAGEEGFAWGLLRSKDGGQTWETVSNEYSYYNLQVDPDNSQKLWSVVYTGFLQWLLGHSTDGGSTWTFYPDMANPWEPVLGLYVDTFWKLYVIHGYGNSMQKSLDHGETWEPIAEEMPFYPLSVFPGTGPNTVTNPLNQNTVFFGSEAGVYRSDDAGQTVHLQEQGMINTYIKDVEVSPNNPAIVYAGGRQGLWKSIDGGESWWRLNTDRVNAIVIDPDHPDTVYWGGGDGLIRSYDGGETGVKIKDGIITALEIRPDSSSILFAGAYPSTLYKSIDYGNTWNKSFSTNPPIGKSFRIKDIEINKADTKVMYFGVDWNWDVHGLYKSTNSGATWEKVSDPGQVVSISNHPNNSDILYVVIREDPIDNIQVSYDGGKNFKAIADDIQAKRMSKIFINPENPYHLLLGTMDQGFFSSTNGGMTWESVPGPYDPRINDIHFTPKTGRIYLGTSGGGVWAGDRTVLGINNTDFRAVPETIYLYPAYPNPFNARTVLTFQLPKTAPAEIIIYDITGKVIKSFSRKTYSGGIHRVRWDGNSDRDLPVHSGVFFIQLKSNHATMTRKITLLK